MDTSTQTPFEWETITKTSLPALESPRFRESGLHKLPNAVSMYERILQGEARAIQDEANENIMLARVVGHLVLELYARRGILGNRPCETIIDEVMRSPTGYGDGDNVVFEVGRQYRDHLIRGFRTSTELYRYPSPSLHPSRPSYDKLEDMTRDLTKPSGKDYRTTRKKALARDGFRCMITGYFDRRSLKYSAELQRMKETLNGISLNIETSHILNESTTQGVGTGEESSVVNKTHFAPGVMAILRQFGLEHLSLALEAVDGVHQIWNLLSLELNLHSDLGRFNLWFESTGEPNCYKVCVSDMTIEQHIRRISTRPETSGSGAPLAVEFRSDLQGAPPPDPQLLALHATCARVAHMSGATEFFDRLEWEAEETNVLAPDGSSAHLLSSLMSPYAYIQEVT
ncbi:hypothetical protein BDM02DRAFT_3122647 [Thelephora ganbajun]|uniref:Uncharacterized protein n=1 Tax=Thelephora ganbajun TaxID=370292 RepID=A0ACB6Z398_THEGA|nr:hypothetical protein BDM02DRAFT_3122647 [Thelephora ganbajun]